MTEPFAFVALVTENLRAPATWTAQPDGSVLCTFSPVLTAAEQTTFDDLSTMARFGVTLTLAEWQSVKPDAALLRTYNGIASPTLAQTIAATKAQNRILATIIRS